MKKQQLNRTELNDIKGGIVYQLPTLVDFDEVGVDAKCVNGRGNTGDSCSNGRGNSAGYAYYSQG